MKVVWTATAVARLEEIEDHIAADDLAAAIRFVDELIDRREGLADSPTLGRSLPELPASGLREIIHANYRIVYRVTKTQLQILTVFEGHRLLRVDELEPE